MKDLSIKVSIGNRVYPLSVQQSEEENIRLAAKEINEMLKEYEQNYAVKDKQDLLAMCALQMATQKLDLKKGAENIDGEIEEKLQNLEVLISNNI